MDAEAHHILDLLEDPSADALVEWFSNHPGAKVIRDRMALAPVSTPALPGAVRPMHSN